MTIKKGNIIIPKKTDIKISGKKAGIYTIIILVLTAMMNLIQTATYSLLDITIRAGIIGLILGLINFIKHKYQ